MYGILVVDDDTAITTLLSQYLERYGFQVHCAHDGAGMHAQLQAQRIDLIVMDVMLPGTDGLTLARLLRQKSQLPIIMLTARADTSDCVVGLELGADDYMGKPFEPRELVARINSVLRRRHFAPGDVPSANAVRFDDWLLQRPERQLQDPQGTVVPLSYAEYRLINHMLEAPRRVFNREELMELAGSKSLEHLDRSVDLVVSRLRHKLGPHGAQLIKTVRGSGYMLDVQKVQACQH